MKLIISLFFLLASSFVSAEVKIYKNDTSLMGVEQTSKGGIFTSTLYGGSSDSGSSSPADCTVKFKLVKSEKGFSGSLLPFSSDLMGYSESYKDGASFEPDKSGITLILQEPLSVCPVSTNFSGDYTAVNKEDKEYESDFNYLLQLNYQNAVKNFREGKGNVAIEALEPYMSESIKQQYYQSGVFNDYGYFLQQAEMNDEAVKYLTIVLKNSPKRVAAYLNIADAYWSLQNKPEAIKNYTKYTSMMKVLGEGEKIPSRAMERSQ